jgi:hypothetical protein
MSDLQKTYRVYCFDGIKGMVTADWIKAATDEEAVAKAEAKGFASQCEVWEGRRLIAELTPSRQQA